MRGILVGVLLGFILAVGIAVYLGDQRVSRLLSVFTPVQSQTQPDDDNERHGACYVAASHVNDQAPKRENKSHHHGIPLCLANTTEADCHETGARSGLGLTITGMTVQFIEGRSCELRKHRTATCERDLTVYAEELPYFWVEDYTPLERAVNATTEISEWLQRKARVSHVEFISRAAGVNCQADFVEGGNWGL